MTFLFLAVVTVTHSKTITHTSFNAFEIFKTTIPIILFFCGLAFNRILEHLKEKKKLDDLEVYYNNLLDYLYYSIEFQIANIMHTSKALKRGSSQKLSIDVVPMFKTEHIKRLNQADLYKIVIERKKGSVEKNTEDYLNIQAALDYIDVVRPSIEKQSDTIVERMNEFNKEFIGELRAVNKILDNRKLELLSAGIKFSDDPILMKIKPRLDSVKDEEAKMNNIVIKYIRPSIQELRVMVKDKDTLEILHAFSRVLSVYNKFDAFRKAQIGSLVSKARGLNHSALQIRESALRLNMGIKVSSTI